MDIVRPSPSQINQLVQQRELRNNSTMAIANTGGVNITGGSNSVLSQSNNMGMTKRHLDNNGSSKWLPAVSNEKTMRGQAAQANNTHTIQIGKGEIQITNQAQSPGPSSIKMYQQNVAAQN